MAPIFNAILPWDVLPDTEIDAAVQKRKQNLQLHPISMG